MERGLLWLPVLIIFIWLAWSGWNEYKKVEAYELWAQEFDNAKYDIYAVLGKKNQQLTWGKPTRKGMVDLNSFSLNDVIKINLLVNGDRVTDISNPPQKGKTALEFILTGKDNSTQIPFTDLAIAIKWYEFLQKQS
ncbi:MAG: hypothetical protein Tsb0014_32450 [Pleurocapsa sp.]